MSDRQNDQCNNADVVGAQNNAAYWLMAVCSIIWGVGYAAIPAPALSYIDDNCETETTALFAGNLGSEIITI